MPHESSKDFKFGFAHRKLSCYSSTVIACRTCSRSEVATLWVHDQKQLDSSVTDSGAIRILNVIDDHATRTLVTRALEYYDMSVTSCDRQGLARHLDQNKFDLIILDIRRSRDEKFVLLRQILSASMPVIITDDHRCAAGDRVAAMELGADDYMSEPIAPRELVARVRAILRRRGRAQVAPTSGLDRGGFRFADLTLDLRTRHLTRSDGARISLTNREYALLFALLCRAGRTLTREHLLSATRLHQDVFDRSIDVVVLRLRRKLEGYPGARRIIETKRGIGYAIEIDVKRLR
jgi:DNA-binding response OmpR family regulator